MGDITTSQRVEFFLGIFHRMLIGFVTIYVTWLCLQRLSFDNDLPWHALLCTIGFNFLMAEGLLSYYKGNSSIQGWFRNGKIGCHIALQLTGSILGIAGIIVRMTIDEVHFTTLHGKLGLATLVLCLISLLLGLSALYSAKMKDWVKPLFNKTIHGVLGIVTYTIAIVCLVYGFDTYIFIEVSPMEAISFGNMAIILKIATIVGLIITIYGPLVVAIRKLWNYFK